MCGLRQRYALPQSKARPVNFKIKRHGLVKTAFRVDCCKFIGANNAMMNDSRLIRLFDARLHDNGLPILDFSPGRMHGARNLPLDPHDIGTKRR